jgi:purine-binding chemotaxis protein CheW
MIARGTKIADADRAATILKERAQRLARPKAQERADGLELLIFVLSGEVWALETRAVREVARFTEFTAVPGGSAVLIGVTNLRGEILPVFDLRKLTGTVSTGLTDHSRLLVLGEERAELGLLADEVREVRVLGRDDLYDPPETLAAVGRGLLRGVTRDAVLVLDGAALLRDPRLFISTGEREA